MEQTSNQEKEPVSSYNFVFQHAYVFVVALLTNHVLNINFVHAMILNILTAVALSMIAMKRQDIPDEFKALY